MRKAFLLLTILFISFSVFSQNKITYGVKAGVNLSGFRTDNGTNSDLIGINIGGVAKMDLNKTFGLQGELNLNSKGGIYRFPLTSNNPEIKLTYINLPVLLKTHITRKFNFEIGPEFGFLVGQKAKVNGETFEIDDVPSFDMNLNDKELMPMVKSIKPKLSNAISHDIANQGMSVSEIMDEQAKSTDMEDLSKLILVSSLMIVF